LLAPFQQTHAMPIAQIGLRFSDGGLLRKLARGPLA
jgi:hypothetical protein